MFDFGRSRPTFTAKEKTALYNDQKGVCNGCKKKFAIQNMTVDHIRPFSQGGGERMSNLQLLCGHCNSLKGDGTMAQLRTALKAKGITKPAATSKAKGTQARKPAKKVTTKKTTARSKKSNDPFAGWF